MCKNRLQLFEFEDQDWFPPLLRRYITDLLQYQLETYQIYLPILPKLKTTLQHFNCHHIVDLCSGSAGPTAEVQRLLAEMENYPISIVLTDKYPNIEAFQRVKDRSPHPIDFAKESIDATDVKSSLEGMRTIFTAFHHFPPNLAQGILRDSFDKQQVIGVFEFTERTFANILKALFLGPLLVWLNTPFIRPLQWRRLFLTYILPVVPLTYTWDAIASHLRTYSPQELRDLTAPLQKKGYAWEIGQVRSSPLGFNITYLIGLPQPSTEKAS
jgi:hypothetical protein